MAADGRAQPARGGFALENPVTRLLAELIAGLSQTPRELHGSEALATDAVRPLLDHPQ